MHTMLRALVLCLVLLAAALFIGFTLLYKDTLMSQPRTTNTTNLDQAHGEASPRLGKNTTRATSKNATKPSRKCIEHSGFPFHPKPNNSVVWKLMATRMHTNFFKDEPSGFAARCSWVIGSRHRPQTSAWGDITVAPKTIFVRTPFLQAFYHRILPCLSHRFVLLTGDHDATIPRQLDFRYSKLMLTRRVWEAILADQRIIHIFSENLDEAVPSRISPLPIGVNPNEFPKGNGDYLVNEIVGASRITDRPLTVLRCDRIRNRGQQWKPRYIVKQRCEGVWKSFCKSASAPSGKPFLTLLQSVSFVICVHGGGLDPSPKAWEALMAGSIPIIEHFAGDASYRELPVVFVDSWKSSLLTNSSLQQWRSQLAPFFENAEKRAAIVQKLFSKYWWSKVEAIMSSKLLVTKRIAIE